MTVVEQRLDMVVGNHSLGRYGFWPTTKWTDCVWQIRDLISSVGAAILYFMYMTRYTAVHYTAVICTV